MSEVNLSGSTESIKKIITTYVFLLETLISHAAFKLKKKKKLVKKMKTLQEKCLRNANDFMHI